MLFNDLENSCGIDFSLKAPGMVFLRNNVLYPLSILDSSIPEIKRFGEYERNFVLLHKKEENETKNADTLTDMILNVLTDNKIENVFIEGYSYMSAGSYYIQLIEYQSVLRYKMFKHNINFHIIPPKSVKKMAGKGNLKKNEMLDAFCELKVTENVKFNLDFQQYCIDNKDSLYIKTKKKKTGLVEITGVKKPFEDIIDSFYCLLCGNDLLKN